MANTTYYRLAVRDKRKDVTAILRASRRASRKHTTCTSVRLTLYTSRALPAACTVATINTCHMRTPTACVAAFSRQLFYEHFKQAVKFVLITIPLTLFAAAALFDAVAVSGLPPTTSAVLVF